MVSQSEFTSMMDQMVASQFPSTRLAYAETKHEVIEDLYAGRAEKYLGKSGESQEADFEFGESIAAMAPAAVSVLTIIKIAAEAYLAIRRATEAGTHASAANVSTASAAGAPPIEPNTLQNDLAHRLGRFLTSDKALEIAAQLVKSLLGTPAK